MGSLFINLLCYRKSILLFSTTTSETEKSLKDVALRSLKRKAEVGIRGSHQYSRVKGGYLGPTNIEPNHIKTRVKNNQYEIHAMNQDNSIEVQLRDSNNRLKALQDLDKRREAQLKKEFEALEQRRKEQEEETKKRISLKQMRLTETSDLGNTKIGRFISYSRPAIKERHVRDKNQQERYFLMVTFNTKIE